jgi:hypothetical protein
MTYSNSTEKSTAFHQLQRLAKYFNKPFNNDQLDEYLDRVGSIPGPAFEQIATDLIEERRPTAGNFPTIKRLRVLWWKWQRDHPEKIRRETYSEPCSECGSKGLLWFKAPKKGYPYWPEYVSICAKCSNWMNSFSSQEGILVTTRAQLSEMGCWVFPYDEANKPYGYGRST